MGWDADAICQEAGAAVDEFVTRNAMIVEGDDWNITLLVTPGKSADAANPTICVHGHPIPFHQLGAPIRRRVPKAVIVSIRQVPANCWPTGTQMP